ncbi:MAG: hypothetical protein K9K64_04615 [Desulfohalobiaceae bacterium]|nr:hypothetical protein [Desulfohalobiaceae bacterium]
MDALQSEVQGLREELAQLGKKHDQDIHELKTDLKHLLDYLNASLENLSKLGEESDKSLEESAEETVKKSLNRILELSKKLLEKLEKDLENGLNEKGK